MPLLLPMPMSMPMTTATAAMTARTLLQKLVLFAKKTCQVLEGLRQFARAAEESNLADHAILATWLHRLCACMCITSSTDAEIRGIWVSFDASSAYADYPPIDGTTVAVWIVLGHAADDMLSTRQRSLCLERSSLSCDSVERSTRWVAWLYDESNRSNRVLPNFLSLSILRSTLRRWLKPPPLHC